MAINAVSDDDEALASFIYQGDERSFGKLYDKYAASLYGMISRIVNNEQMAEDILNKVFVDARNQATAFTNAGTMFFNRLFNSSRQMAFHALKQQRNPLYQKAVYGDDNITAFELLYYKGLNYNEAAAALNKSVEEVKADVRAAIKNLNTKETI